MTDPTADPLHAALADAARAPEPVPAEDADAPDARRRKRDLLEAVRAQSADLAQHVEAVFGTRTLADVAEPEFAAAMAEARSAALADRLEPMLAEVNDRLRAIEADREHTPAWKTDATNRARRFGDEAFAAYDDAVSTAVTDVERAWEAADDVGPLPFLRRTASPDREWAFWANQADAAPPAAVAPPPTAGATLLAAAQLRSALVQEVAAFVHAAGANRRAVLDAWLRVNASGSPAEVRVWDMFMPLVFRPVADVGTAPDPLDAAWHAALQRRTARRHGDRLKVMAGAARWLERKAVGFDLTDARRLAHVGVPAARIATLRANVLAGHRLAHRRMAQLRARMVGPWAAREAAPRD